MQFNAILGEDGKITIELIGEDGRVISRKVQAISGKPGSRFWLSQSLPFEISAAAETARLQISTHDQFGRTEALTSADLVLLQVGHDDLNPSAITQDPYIFRQPEQGAVVSGGVLEIDGLARPVNDSPLLIELVTEDGAVLTVKQLVVPAPTGALSHTPFTAQIPYKVSGPTPVRLVIRQEGSRIPGTVELSSELITLAP